MSASDEEDDFYGSVPSKPETPSVAPGPASGSKKSDVTGPNGGRNDETDEDLTEADGEENGGDDGDEGGDDEDNDDNDDNDDDGDEEDGSSDSDIEIITERPPLQISTPIPLDIKLPTRVPVTITAPPSVQNQVQSPALTHTTTSTKIEPTKIVPSKFGANLPEVRTSTTDVNRVPEWEAVGKPITEIDIDADLAEQAKPWRMPGADQTDYFNYGFDEFTWATYCLRQQSMAGTLQEQKAEAQKFEMMLSGGMMGQMPGGPGHGHGHGHQAGMMNMMPGMDDHMMHQMMSNMMAQGVDPNELNFDTFMKQMQQMQGGMPAGMQGQIPPQGPAGMLPPSGPSHGPPHGPMHGQPPGSLPSGPGQNMVQQGQWPGGNNKMRRW